MKRSHVLGSLVGLAAAAGLLAGCATGAASSPTASPSSSLRMFGPDANWIDSGRAIALVTLGSEYCPLRLHDVTASGQTLTVALQTKRTDIGCQDDQQLGVYVPLPDGVATDEPVTLSVTTDDEDPFELTVPALPKAAVEVESQHPAVTMLSEPWMAILTWGSSTCLPQVKDAATSEASGSPGLVVKFETEKNPCTADLAPRITVVDAEGFNAGDPVTLENLDGADTPVTTAVQFPAPKSS